MPVEAEHGHGANSALPSTKAFTRKPMFNRPVTIDQIGG